MKVFFLTLCLVLPVIAEDAPAPVPVSEATRAALHTPLKEYASAVASYPIQDEPGGDLGKFDSNRASCGRWESPCSKPNR